MKTMKKDICLAIILFAGSFILLLFISQNAKPISPLFPMQRLDESLILLIKRSPDEKVEYYQYLLQKRFSDISYVVQTDHRDILVSVSLRYSTTVGKAVQIASAFNVRKSQLRIELEQQKLMLINMITHYVSNDNRQKFIQDDINYINIYEKDL